jgi:hypothetical protein
MSPILFALLTAPVAAQNDPYRAELQIDVSDYETGAPISGAEIACLRGDKVVHSSTTDITGRLQLTCVPGNVTIRAMHPDYELLSIKEELESGANRIRVRLRPPASASMTIVSEAIGDEVSRTVVSIDELKSVPGTFGDPVKAIQTLPGVARPNIAEGGIVVRGAEGINTGYYVDGMPVPYMFHTLVGRSVVIPGFIDDIEFFPGGMPSRYGEVTQAAVNVRTDTEPVGATHASLTMDFLDGSLSFEHRITPDLTVRVAGRKSWASAFIWAGSAIAVKRNGGEAYQATYIAPKYSDAFADVRWQATPTDMVSVMAMYSRDKLVFREAKFDADGDGEPDPYVWEDQDLPYNPPDWIDNYYLRARVRWDHDGPVHDHSTWISSGPEQQQNLLGAWWLSRQGPYRGRVTGVSTIVRRDDRWALEGPILEKGSAIVHGFQLTLRPVTAMDFQDVFDDPTANVATTTDDQATLSAWVEGQFKFGDWYVAPGMRGAAYAYNGKTSLQPEPRFTMRRSVSENWYVKGALGRYSQMPPIERYAQGIGNPDLPIMTAWQASIGAEGDLPYGFSLDSAIFLGLMDNLVVRDLVIDVYNDGGTAVSELNPEFLDVTGRSYGAEVLLRMKPQQSNWWGWVSFTYARAWRIDDSGRRFPGDYDQPLSLSVVGAYDLPRNWEISGRMSATSGQPFTPIFGVYVPQDQYFAELRGELNSDRYPAYFRLDVRAQKTWQRRHTDWTAYLDVYNTTWRQNPILATYNYDYSELQTLAHLPLLPTLGIEVSY